MQVFALTAWKLLQAHQCSFLDTCSVEKPLACGSDDDRLARPPVVGVRVGVVLLVQKYCWSPSSLSPSCTHHLEFNQPSFTPAWTCHNQHLLHSCTVHSSIKLHATMINVSQFHHHTSCCIHFTFPVKQHHNSFAYFPAPPSLLLSTSSKSISSHALHICTCFLPLFFSSTADTHPTYLSQPGCPPSVPPCPPVLLLLQH